jgi:hypothetical protein
MGDGGSRVDGYLDFKNDSSFKFAFYFQASSLALCALRKRTIFFWSYVEVFELHEMQLEAHGYCISSKVSYIYVNDEQLLEDFRRLSFEHLGVKL